METPRGNIYLLGSDPGNRSDIRAAESGDGGIAAERARILVVDDERLLADTTAAILRRAGFDAKIAYEGFDALEMAASFRPDYLLTDIMMPGMNGVELAIAITKLYPTTKILLFSGQAGISGILQQSKERGFEFPLLPKPVHPSRLIEELKTLPNS